MKVNWSMELKKKKKKKKKKKILKIWPPPRVSSGKKFYKALAKSSKIRKRSKEISKQLGSTPSKKRRNDRDRFNGPRSNQHFRSEAPSRGARGGGRINFKPRRPTKSHRDKSMSFVRVSKCTCTTNQVKPSGSGRTSQLSKSDIKSRSGSQYCKKLAACPTKHKLSHREKTTILPEELAINNPRQFYSANCSGHGDRFPGNTNTDGLSFTESKQKECLTDRPGGTENDPKREQSRKLQHAQISF